MKTAAMVKTNLVKYYRLMILHNSYFYSTFMAVFLTYSLGFSAVLDNKSFEESLSTFLTEGNASTNSKLNIFSDAVTTDSREASLINIFAVGPEGERIDLKLIAKIEKESKKGLLRVLLIHHDNKTKSKSNSFTIPYDDLIKKSRNYRDARMTTAIRTGNEDLIDEELRKNQIEFLEYSNSWKMDAIKAPAYSYDITRSDTIVASAYMAKKLSGLLREYFHHYQAGDFEDFLNNFEKESSQAIECRKSI